MGSRRKSRRKRKRSPGSGRIKLTLIGMLAGIFAVAAGHHTYRWAVNSGVFRINELPVRGNILLDDEEVRKLSGLQLGMQILKIEPLEIEEGMMEKSPWVKKARVSRLLPSRVEIAIEERIPRAIIGKEQLFCLDEDAVVLPFDPRRSNVDLPFISSIRPLKKIQPGEKISEEGIERALSFLKNCRMKTPRLSYEISELYFDQDRNLNLVTTRGGIRVLVGKENFGDAAVNFNAFMEQVGLERNGPLSHIDLRFKNQVVILPKG